MQLPGSLVQCFLLQWLVGQQWNEGTLYDIYEERLLLCDNRTATIWTAYSGPDDIIGQSFDQCPRIDIPAWQVGGRVAI